MKYSINLEKINQNRVNSLIIERFLPKFIFYRFFTPRKIFQLGIYERFLKNYEQKFF